MVTETRYHPARYATGEGLDRESIETAQRHGVRSRPSEQLQKTRPPNSHRLCWGSVGEQTERGLEKLQVVFKGRWPRYVSSRSPSCSEGPSARPCFPSSLRPRELPYR